MIIRVAKRGSKRPRRHQCYIDRNVRLSWLGYSSYPEYLKSQEWADIRTRVLAKNSNCLLCQKPASQVHHMDYSDKVFLGLCDDALVSLCEKCHEFIEIAPHGAKRTLWQANNILLKSACQNPDLKKWVSKQKRLLNRLLDEQDMIDARQMACTRCGRMLAVNDGKTCSRCIKSAGRQIEIIRASKRFKKLEKRELEKSRQL